MGPSHKRMVRLQVADGRTTSRCGEQLRMYLKSSRAWPTRCGPSCWGLGEVLTTAHSNNLRSYEIFNKPSDLVKKNEMGRVCGTCGAKERCI